LFQSIRSVALQNLRRLRKQLKSLSPDLQPVAQQVLERESQILELYRQLIQQNFEAARIRIHGDFHLGQVLWTGRDFVFLGLEGDANVTISERQIKRSPLQDVARMLRSFHHAAYAGFHKQVELGVIARENLPQFEPWVRHWNRAVSRAFLQTYCEKLKSSALIPVEEEKLRTMLMVYLLNQVLDELGRELPALSENIRVPLLAVLYLTDEPITVHATPEAEPKAVPPNS
jgi:maltose alpha-D-glucosyltransferase/alpha-amylase